MVRGTVRPVTLLVLMAVFLGGCGANHHSIYRSRVVSNTAPTITTIDAKQRALITSPGLPSAEQNSGSNAQQTHEFFRICTEPSPDVFAIIAQSLSGTGSFGRSADPAAVEAAASFAGSSAEQASTIPRTQTINMLREMMYRTCERFLNRGISELELPIQAIRDQRLMVSILAIEQLTGAVAPGPVRIGASGEGSAGVSAAEGAVRLDESWKVLQTAEATQRTRQTEYDALNSASPSCDSLKEKAEAGTALAAEEITKRNECTAAAEALATAKTGRQEASQHHEDMRSAIQAVRAGPASASTALMAGDLGSGEIARAHTDAVQEVAEHVENIVRLAFEQDEFGLFCLRYLSPDPELHQDLQQACIRYLQSRVILEASQAEMRAREIAATSAAYDRTVGPLFNAFWSKIAPEGTVDEARLADIVVRAQSDFERQYGTLTPPNLRRLTSLRNIRGQAEMMSTFQTLDQRLQEILGAP